MSSKCIKKQKMDVATVDITHVYLLLCEFNAGSDPELQKLHVYRK